ncbi:MAG: hypothetical protein CL862_11085 [Cyanobium sp. NAT70]|nr:hypothetical protein [Cyanobium sp. NAT70]
MQHLHEHVELLPAVEGRVLQDVGFGAPGAAHGAEDVEGLFVRVEALGDRQHGLATLGAVPATEIRFVLELGKDVEDGRAGVGLGSAEALDLAEHRRVRGKEELRAPVDGLAHVFSRHGNKLLSQSSDENKNLMHPTVASG